LSGQWITFKKKTSSPNYLLLTENDFYEVIYRDSSFGLDPTGVKNYFFKVKGPVPFNFKHLRYVL
jgi:hypothetical protein